MEFTFFWNGPLSQWSTSPFMGIDGLMYNCCEQAMMAQKALLFKDKATFKKIMATTNPKEHKSLGKQVKNFNQIIWDTMSYLIVYDINILKFSQCPKHKEALLATGDTILVEASPSDLIWGIGMCEDDPRAKDMSQWKGQNRLGFILTKVREVIIDEESYKN
jgi:ribA/ribD-fused uncharacterized protein